jgi:predicted dienelactone hydrolase
MGTFWRDNLNPDDDGQRIAITRGEWIDESRDGRKIPYKLYVPKETDETLPLVIWSHGLGGSRDGAGFLSRFIAGHGYAVLNIQHPGTDLSLWLGKPGHPWDAIRAVKLTDDVKIARFYDVEHVLTRLGDLAEEANINLNLNNIGFSGHSMGAITTQVMAGQKFRGKSYKSDAFKAFLPYSQMPCRDGSENPYDDMTAPLFMMTGTEDDSPVDGYDYTARQEVFDSMPESTTRYALILKDGDHMVFAGSRGQLEGYDKIPEHERIIKIASLAWWDWHLKGNEKAHEWLNNDLENWSDGEASLEYS